MGDKGIVFDIASWSQGKIGNLGEAESEILFNKMMPPDTAELACPTQKIRSIHLAN